MNKYLMLALSFVALSACEVAKTPVAIEGSRADASIVMGYEVSMFEQASVDWLSAGQEATKRCQVWGYKSASAFAGVREQCQAYNGYGNCVRATVSKTYQCTG